MKKNIDYCCWTTDVKREDLERIVLHHYKKNNPHIEDEKIFSDMVQKITNFAQEYRLDIHEWIEYVVIPFSKDF